MNAKLLAFFAACLVVLAACAPGGGTKNSTTQPAQKPKLPASKTLSATITYWSWRDKAEVDSEVAQFHKEYPNIKVVYKKLNNYPQDIQQLTAGLLSANGPDIFDLGDSYYQQFLPYMYDLTPLAKQTLGTDWQSKMTTAGSKSFTLNQKLMTAPFGMEYQGAWLVNQTMLKSLGLKDPTNMNADQLGKWCAAIRSAGKDCVLLGNQVPTLGQAVVQTIASQQAPGKWAAAVSGKGNWTDLSSPFAELGKLQTTKVFQAGSVNAAPYPDLMDEFTQQKAAAIVLGSWTLPLYDKANWAGNVGPKVKPFEVQLVVPSGFSTSNPAQMPSVGTGIAINKKTKQLQADSAFVAWMSFSEAGAHYLSNTVSPVSALKGIEPQYNYMNPADQKVSYQSYLTAASISNERLGIPCTALQNAVNQAVQSALTGKAVDATIAALQKTAVSVQKSCAKETATAAQGQ